VLLYLTQLEVRDLALASKRLEGDDDGGYYIKHADDKGDNVLRDGEGNIVGVIDWEW
jgi:aminoglycoside phosphotransferase (APT) family kinase protein